MRKRVRIALAVLVIAVLGLILLAIISRPAPEPAYQGKTLSQWLVLLDSDPAHKAQNDDSARAIESMGKQALPVLIRILQRRSAPVWLGKVETWAVHFGLWRASGLPLDERQYRAARGCCILGGWINLDITPAIPALAYHATNAASRRLEPYMWGLVYSGPEGLSIVTNLLARAASPQVREEAARSLWITPKIRTPEIANALLSATRDVDASVRVTSILSLQSFLRQKGLDEVIVPGVIQHLQDTNSEVRRWTIQLLANYSSAPDVGAAVSNLLSDPVPEVRSEAERVLHGSHSNAGQK
jgi:hypothetical protein